MEGINYTALLPKEPPEGLTGWLLSNGGFVEEFLIYRSGRRYVPLEERWEDCVEVICTACEQSFAADKVHTGTCHNAYAPAPFGWYNPRTSEAVICNQHTICPVCGASCTTAHIGNMSAGITRNEFTTVMSRVTVEGSRDRLALVEWKTTRQIDKRGVTRFGHTLYAAYVVEERKIVRISGHGKLFYSYYDCAPVQRKTFYDDYGKYCKLWPVDPKVLEGTTAENCKLDRYAADGGLHLVAYLSLWRKRPQVENLIMQGCGKLVDELIEREQNVYGTRKTIPKLTGIDWKKKRPNEMMRMGKADWRSWGRGMDARDHINWIWALDHDLPVDRERLGLLRTNEGSLKSILDLLGRDAFYRGLRYLQKQKQGWGVLRDYWNMARKLDMDMDAEQVKWPKDLKKAHDAAVKLYNERKDELDNAAFGERLKKLGPMEWHDGGILIRPCATAAELRAEGSTLSHCVYSYANRHKKGETAIFFIRKEEEPDKPWFTLELDEKNLVVRQNRGLRNCGKTPEVQGFEDRWIAHLKQMKKKTKTRKKKKEEQAA